MNKYDKLGSGCILVSWFVSMLTAGYYVVDSLCWGWSTLWWCLTHNWPHTHWAVFTVLAGLLTALCSFLSLREDRKNDN